MKQQGSNISQRLRHHVPTAVAVVALAILFLCGALQVEAGCSRFGHSCFGAHGKRGDVPANVEIGVDGRILGSQQPNGDNFPINYNPSVANMNAARLSPYFIDWLVSSHRDQEAKSQDRFKEDPSQPLEMKK